MGDLRPLAELTKKPKGLVFTNVFVPEIFQEQKGIWDT